MSGLSVQHLLGTEHLDPEDHERIFQTADHFKEVLGRPIKKVPSLQDLTISNIFFESSTRTRLSFELAEKRLSADVVNFSASGSSLSKGETLIDTVDNILSMKVDMVVLRHPSPGAARFLSENTDSIVINAGDGTHEHPTQALLDAYSIREALGQVQGKKVLIVGDILHSRVALSNIFCLRTLGAAVRVCGPLSLIPKHIRSLGVEVETDLQKGLEWCDIANMLRIQLERQKAPTEEGEAKATFFPSLREYRMMYGLDKELVGTVDNDFTIMHPGPINRGVELSSEVADSDRSIILDQVENGVAVRMAVLYLLAGSLERE
ncbi:MAG: aspartate carbamoyltransferase catalytic subunit [Flavobacteriales bacterium]